MLADFVLALANAGGAIKTVIDDREAKVGTRFRREVDDIPNGSAEHDAALNRYLSTMLAHRNTVGGFWVAADDPHAATQAFTGSTPIASSRSPRSSATAPAG